MEICNLTQCTGCGMCSNICPHSAIEMRGGQYGFMYPYIDEKKCVDCRLCIKKCPANKERKYDCTMQEIYAAWNKFKSMRKRSTSGGVCSLIERDILKDGGVVVGVRWDDNFCPEHAIAVTSKEAEKFRGSKYIQSNTGEIYIHVKRILDEGRKVFFSGTPCQIAAVKSFLGREYSNLYTMDVVCHGVPSYSCFKKYLDEITPDDKAISNIRLRYKSPYWDYCSVRIDFLDGSHYQKYTVDDPYFTLFNIGYTLRESCHNCRYTTIHREGDITLADFWGYQPSCFKMMDYNKGTSVVAVNSGNGRELFEKIKAELVYEKVSLEDAMKTNKSFSESYVVPDDMLEAFWNDYEEGMTTKELCKTYVPKPFRIPSLLFLRRLKNRYRWVIKRK